MIDTKTMTDVLSKILDTKVIRTDYKTEQLLGVTLGDVQLVSGIAITSADKKSQPPILLLFKNRRRK